MVYFIFQPSYWCGSKRKYELDHHGEVATDNQYFERDPAGAQIGISIKHLKKVGF